MTIGGVPINTEARFMMLHACVTAEHLIQRKLSAAEMDAIIMACVRRLAGAGTVH